MVNRKHQVGDRRHSPVGIVNIVDRELDICHRFRADIVAHYNRVVVRSAEIRDDRVRVVLVKGICPQKVLACSVDVQNADLAAKLVVTFGVRVNHLVSALKVIFQRRVHPLGVSPQPKKMVALVYRDNTHVSLKPPPCDEFTINESGFLENRVSPLGHTFVSPPASTNARKSAFLGTSVPSVSRISKS